MWPYYDDDDIKLVTDILKSGKVNYWTGEHCKKFEKEFSSKFECRYSVALANGSLALNAAYKALNLKEGDEIITTPRTFLATASIAVLQGLKPIFADVDKNTGCITTEYIEPLITKKTKAISIVHIGGWPAEMKMIRNLADTYNLKIIEDCSQAHGAKINNENVGNFGDVATWSFCQDKIISTGGEGGMLTTNNKEIYKYVLSYKDHGTNFDLLNQVRNEIGFKWIHEHVGTNLRLTEMQSAIGRNQLKKIHYWNMLRNRNSEILFKILKNLPLLRIPMPEKNITHAWYRFYCYLNSRYLSSNWNRDRIIEEIKELGVDVFSGSCSEIYLEKCFKDLDYYPKKRLPNAKELGETSLAFLVHPTISEEEQLKKAYIVKSVLEKAIK